MKKPLPVLVLEFLAWVFFVIACCGAAFSLLRAAFYVHYRSGFEMSRTLLLVLLAILFAALLHAVRRARFAWFSIPPCVVMILVGGFVSSHMDSALAGIGLFLLVCVVALAPVVLLNLPKAKAWQREVFAKGGKDKAGLMVALSLFAFFYAAVSIPSCVSRPRTHVYVAETEAKAINCGLDENNSSREKGGEWVDPSTCTNSTQFVNALYDKLGMERRHDEWCIAVNPPNDDRFPVLFTANIDPRELLRPSGEGQPLKLTCPKEWGGVCFKFCEKMGVVHYKNGVSQIVKKHMSPKQIFCSGIPKPGPETYFLTPTGRVDFVERQGSAMAISMNLKLISIDKSERCVVAEFLLENCSQRGVFVFGSKDALTTYFMKDGVWVLCSTANDVGNEPAEERGLFVEKGNVLRVSGRIPQECLLAKWFLVVGIGTRSKDEMESIVASPIYSRDNESGDRLSFKMEMNSVFKGRLKAFIANE
ncbi:MAG: hypothetical protein IKJ89_01720 [Kiritimatiellae bacterium]|nr:hypothetical protein [Kiritimatiellia bacterium]